MEFLKAFAYKKGAKVGIIERNGKFYVEHDGVTQEYDSVAGLPRDVREIYDRIHDRTDNLDSPTEQSGTYEFMMDEDDGRPGLLSWEAIFVGTRRRTLFFGLVFLFIALSSLMGYAGIVIVLSLIGLAVSYMLCWNRK